MSVSSGKRAGPVKVVRNMAGAKGRGKGCQTLRNFLMIPQSAKACQILSKTLHCFDCFGFATVLAAARKGPAALDSGGDKVG